MESYPMPWVVRTTVTSCSIPE
ncbi:hypothetical protein A2U01_0090425, partial [Trifolium medium]|nr:hypothetical protein [Trifolium medium]